MPKLTLRTRPRLQLTAFATTILLLAGVLTSCSSSQSEPGEYPDRQVTLVVPFPAGGAADAVGRELVDDVKDSFSEGISVENRDGGGGVVGMTEVFNSDPDGYKLGIVAQTTTTLTPHTVDGISWDTPDDYESIIQVAYAPLVIVTRADAPWKNFDEFIQAAKSDDLKYGSAGEGTPSHLALESLKLEADFDLTHVPFEGDAPALTALLGGNVDAGVQAPGTILGQVESGDLKVLATLEPERSDVFPDAPTVVESGYDVVMASYFGIYGPKGMPSATIAHIHDAFKKGIETSDFEQFLKSRYFVEAYLSSEDMDASLRENYDGFRDLAEQIGLG